MSTYNGYNEETVLNIRHWTETLFSFTSTRTDSFRYENGQFTMMGLEVDGKPLVRAYSMVSPNYDETLEWFSIKVPDGPLTSRLQHIKEGDRILVSKKPVGTLIVDNLMPGGAQMARDLLFVGESGVIGSQGDPHHSLSSSVVRRRRDSQCDASEMPASRVRAR